MGAAAVQRTRIAFVRPQRFTFGFPEIYGLILLAAAFTARFVPLSRLWGECTFRRLTGGWPCLSCGMTRSFDWFAQGRFADSFLINPLGFLAALSGAVLSLYAILSPLRPPRLKATLDPVGQNVLRYSLVALVVGDWAYLLIRHALGFPP